MSSHMLSEVEAAVGRVAIIRDGLIVGVDEISTFRSDAGQHVSFEFADPVGPEMFDQVENFDEVVIFGSRVEGILRGSPDELLKTASQFEVIAWSAQDRDLEELFLEFYRETLPGDAELGSRARG